MIESATVTMVYKELKAIRRDLLEVKYALLPVEKVSSKERKELDRIFRDMESGGEKSFSEIVSK